ncbi:MAG: hypothetical protein RR444_05065 [Oscillospiraceae bacterium]
MDRLTHSYIDGGYWASILKISACGENECRGEIIDKLAAYEEIGTPEQIAAWKEVAERLLGDDDGCLICYGEGIGCNVYGSEGCIRHILRRGTHAAAKAALEAQREQR